MLRMLSTCWQHASFFTARNLVFTSHWHTAVSKFSQTGIRQISEMGPIIHISCWFGTYLLWFTRTDFLKWSFVLPHILATMVVLIWWTTCDVSRLYPLHCQVSPWFYLQLSNGWVVMIKKNASNMRSIWKWRLIRNKAALQIICWLYYCFALQPQLSTATLLGPFIILGSCMILFFLANKQMLEFSVHGSSFSKRFFSARWWYEW